MSFGVIVGQDRKNAFLQYERSNQTLGMRKGINLAARASISHAKFQRQAYEKNGRQTKRL